MRKQWTRIVAAGVCVASLGPVVWGQDIPARPRGIVVTAQEPPAAQDADPTARFRQQAENEVRIGVTAGKSVPLALRDAILMALQKNNDIEIQRIGVQQSAFDLDRSKGAYDPVLSANLFYETRRTPNASLIGGANADGFVENNTATGGASFGQLLKSGGRYSVDFSTNRATTNNTFAALNPSFNSSLSLNFTQPLARNLNLDAARRQTLLARKRLDLSDSQFRQRVIEIIANVQRAYWDLVFARRDVEIKEEAVNLARTQLEQNKRFVEAGTLAPVEIVSVEALLEQRQEELLISLENLTRAENALKPLILDSRSNQMWNDALNPTEQIAIQSFALPLAEAVETALKNRPEMEQFQLQRESNKIDLDYFKNQLKPQVDLVASYSLAGLSGQVLNVGNPFGSSNQILADRLNLLSARAGLQPITLPAPGTIPSFFSGSLGQSLNTLFTRNFRDVRVGVNFSFPFGNRTAKADLGRAKAQDRLIGAQQAKQEEIIESEVRNALQAVQTTLRRVQSSRASRIASETQLASEQRRYEVGESTNFLVLERQKSLSDARGRELRALTDYNKAVADLQRVLSTTLTANNLQVVPAKESAPQADPDKK